MSEKAEPTRAELTTFAHHCEAEGWTLAEFIDVMEKPSRWFVEIREAVLRGDS